MPRLLADRLRTFDTVSGLAKAADQRARDAECLYGQGHGLAAIYLFGYEVEMRVKAAYFRYYFSLRQLPPTTRIDTSLRQQVIAQHQQLGLPRKPGHHDILGWSQLLVSERRSRHNPYSLVMERAVLDQAELISQRWSEVLRYRANIPYRHELRTVREVAAWFRLQYKTL